MKKTLAILLSLALVICMIPATAFAEPTPINADMVKLSKTTTVYNGTNQLPDVTVTGVTGDNYSIKWVQGSLSQANEFDSATKIEGATNAGTYSVLVKGNALESAETGYTGSVIKQFKITKCDLSQLSISIPEQEDDTNEKLQEKIKSLIVFKNTDNIQLNLNNDIKVTVSDNTTNSKKAVVEGATNNVTGTSSSVIFSVKPGISNYVLNGVEPKTYTGQQIKQNSAYLSDSNGTKVDSRVTYELKYSNNTEAGTASVWAEGIGSYVGKTKPVQFQIAQASANDAYRSGQLVVSDIPNQIVNAKPSVTITERGETQPIDPSTYSVSYQNNDVAGTAKAIISFSNKGNYSGSIEKTFTVISGDNVINYGDASIVGAGIGNVKSTYYNGTTQSVSVNVAKSGATYRVEYRNSKGVVTSPKDAGDYFVYVIGTGNYAGEVLAGTLRIMPIPLDWTEIVLGSSTVYDSASRTYVPKVTLRTKAGYPYGYSGYVTIPETDYNVSYKWVNSTSAYFKPTAVVTLASNAVNLTKAVDTKITEITQEFNNATKNIAYCTASFTDGRSSSAYTGSAITPKVTVRDGYTILATNAYDVTYKNASGKVVASIKDAGTYTVVIKGKGIYYGELTLTYTIVGTDISGYTVTLKESSVNATGYAQTPVITSVKKGYYYSLTSSDYTVTYQDSTGKTVSTMSAPGTYKVVVTGKNGYSGSTYATFRIVGLPQTVTVTQDSYKVYATSDSFKITAKASGDATGFTYTSSNPAVASVSAAGYVTMHKVGRAVITVTATGMKKYEPAYETVEVKVYPKKAVMTKKPWTDGKKYQAKVRWTYQDGATSYQVRYSRDKNFGAGTYKTKTVKAHGKDYTTQSTTLKSLKSKSTYYIKVRAVYTDPVTGDTYYGAWSGWRSVKTK